jgi:hypothetical protein
MLNSGVTPLLLHFTEGMRRVLLREVYESLAVRKHIRSQRPTRANSLSSCDKLLVVTHRPRHLDADSICLKRQPEYGSALASGTGGAKPKPGPAIR